MEVSLSEVLEVVGSCKKIDEAAEKLGCHKVELIYFLRKFIKREGLETWASAAKKFKVSENPVFSSRACFEEIQAIVLECDRLAEAEEKTSLGSYLSPYLKDTGIRNILTGPRVTEVKKYKVTKQVKKYKLEQIFSAILNTPSFSAAAARLKVDAKELRYYLQERVPHKRGQKWSISVAQYIEANKVTMNSDSEKIIQVVAECWSLREAAQKLDTTYTALKKFLEKNINHTPGDTWRYSAREHLGLRTCLDEIWDI